MTKSALIVGASGLVGQATAKLLVEEGWEVLGLARRPVAQNGVTPLTADLRDPESLKAALASTKPTHVFFATWMRQDTNAELTRVNVAMLRNLLDALRPLESVQHVALVTGLKHYLGSFEAFGTGAVAPSPFREEFGRLDIDLFFYAQEDELFAAAARDGFSWSVHRPHTIIGKAVGNAMNMGTTLAVFATICRETGRPFRFPGSQVQWEKLTDVTDVRLLARHLLWAATTPAAANEAFNVVDGDVFRWNWMWGRIADWFGVEPAPFEGERHPLDAQVADTAPIWRGIAERHGLVEPDLARLASAWHTDSDLGRPVEALADMSKSRKLGFSAYQATDDAFFDLFEELRRDRLIP